jgi:hypothetical protein
MVARDAALLGVAAGEEGFPAPDQNPGELVERLELPEELRSLARRSEGALAVAEDLVRHGHDPAHGGFFEAIVDAPRNAKSPLARDERAVRLADPHVHFGDAAAELGDQVPFGGELLGQEQRLVVSLDCGLIVELVERDVAEELQGDHLLALEPVLLRLRERAADVGLRAAQVPSDAEMLPEAKPRLHLATGVPALAAKERARAGKLLVRLLEPAKLGQGDTQVQREIRFLVGESGAARLELTAGELPDCALDLSGAQEAKPKEIPASEHPLEVFEIPPADVIRRPEMLLGSRRTADAPHRPSRGDVIFENRLLVIRSVGVELLELLLGQVGHFPPAAQTEERPAARERDGLLDLRGHAPPALEFGDEIERRSEPRMRDQFLEPTLEGRAVRFMCAIVNHGLKGACRKPGNPRLLSPSRPSTDAEADQQTDVDGPAIVRAERDLLRRARTVLNPCRSLGSRAWDIVAGRIAGSIRLSARPVGVDRSRRDLFRLDGDS